MIDYWEQRKKFQYYKAAIDLAHEFASDARTAIDVGSGNTKFLQQVDWVAQKTAVDLDVVPRIQGAKNHRIDFMKFQHLYMFDLVFCLQVLEHLELVHPFAKKLMCTGRIIIISVPYKWPADSCEWHLQDPIDEIKLLKWIGRQWFKSVIVEDEGNKRLVAAFAGNRG